ncbi:hypothetical protein BC827DRAFT_1160972 [Russula dissimulans]|nr:hypothetical protein BC827DRAFT_1160972 [Russula dissimulans]
MSSHSRPSTSSTERSESRVAEEWQLQILWELHQKKPHPTLEQRRLLATQTGLDAKWVARWFKRVNGASNKSKLQSMVGHTPSGPQISAATATTKARKTKIDNASDSAKSANLASVNGASPSLSTAVGDNVTFVISGSGGVPSEGVRSVTASPHHAHKLRSLDVEHPGPTERSPVFYPHPQGGAHPTLPRSHHNVAEHSQRPLGIVSTTPPVGFTSSFIQHGGTGMNVQSVKSRGPRDSSSRSPDPVQTSRIQLDLASPFSSAACNAEPSHPRHDLSGPASAASPGAAAVAAATVTCMHGLDLLLPDIVPPQVASGSSPAPFPSIYRLLFDTDYDAVDWHRGPLSRPPSRLLLGNNVDVAASSPHAYVATPTPVSFLAKWEDMLALERRIRSSHNNAHLVSQRQSPSKQAQLAGPAQTQVRAQAVVVVETNRDGNATKRESREAAASSVGSANAGRGPCRLDPRCADAGTEVDKQQFGPGRSPSSGALVEGREADGTPGSYACRRPPSAVE